MRVISTKTTNNPSIIKFELDDFIIKTESFEFKNIDETQRSPLAKQLFFLPFVKTVYISGNFIAIEKFSIVEWEDVQEDVANQINDFIANGGTIITIVGRAPDYAEHRRPPGAARRNRRAGR